MELRVPARARLATLVIAVIALGAACLQGARAPSVAPRGTLAPGDAEAALSQKEGPFGVAFASPRGATIDPGEITVVWNRPVHPLEVAGQETPPPVVVKPAVPGHWIWVGTAGASFNPEGGLPRATEYTVEIPAGTRALDGATMDKPYVFHFSTVRPRVESASPAGSVAADALEPGSKIALRVNQPVEAAEAARAIRFDSTVQGGHERKAVPVDVRADDKSAQVLWVTPRAPLPLDTAFELTVAASLRGREGPLLAEGSQTFAFHTYGPLEVRGVDCDRDGPKEGCGAGSGFSIGLSNRVKIGDLKKALRVEPAVAVRWPTWLSDDDLTERLPVFGRFAPGRMYRVSLAVVRDEHGQALAAPFGGSVTFDDLWPKATIGLTGTFLEPGVKRVIPVASVNVDRMELATAALDEAAVLALQGDGHAPPHPPRVEDLRRLPGGKVVTLRPAAGVDRPARHEVSTEGVLGGKDRRGPMAIAIAYTQRPGTSRARLEEESVVAQVTDLGISAKVSRHGSLVWVTRLSSGAPVAGAAVHVATPGGGARATFTTDGSGFALIPEEAFKPANDGEERAVIFARSGDDWAYRPVSDMVNVWRLAVPVDLGPDRPFGMLFTDRGIYRPGDVAHVKGILRMEAPHGLETPAGRTVDLVFSGPDGEAVGKQSVALSAFGTLAVDLPVPATGRLGTYSITASVQGSGRGYPDVNGDFEVAEYRAAEFKVGVESDRPSYVRGDKASWTAHGDYLFGAPMSGAEAVLRVTRAETSFRPPDTDGLSLDDDAYRSGRLDATQPSSEVQNAGAKLDAGGTAELAAALALPGQHGAEIVTAEADVTDLSRQTLTGSTSAVVHPGEFYLGLDPGPETFVKATDALSPKVSAVTPAGVRTAGVSVTVQLVQRRWTIARQEVGGGHRTASGVDDHVVATCTVTTRGGKDPPASCALQPSGVGYYLVRATAKDGRGNPIATSAGVYATGDAGETSWSDGDTMSVELVPDRKSYQVGQTAHVLVKSPFKSAEAWITVERDGVYTRRLATLTGAMPTIDVPVTADLRPNAFVSVLLVRGRSKAAPAKAGAADVGAPAFRLGYAAIRIDPEARRLRVGVRPAKQELHPGDTVEVDVHVADHDGKPAQAEVTLYAVDEGVLSLIGYKTPDPIPVFGAERALKVTTLESRDALARVLNPFAALGLDKGLDGGSGGSTGVRRDFRPSAYWGPALVTDDRGSVHASFKLPDSLTTYRIMAVATATDDRFGFGEDRVVASRPLLARPAFPRFLRAGDALDAGVVVTAKGLTGRTHVEVGITVEGLTLKGEGKKTVDLDHGGSAEVRFALEAPRVGPAKVSFRVSGGGAEDRVEITREVKVPMTLEAAALSGETSHEAAEKLGDLKDIRDDAGGLTVSTSSTALVGLGGGVEQLVSYPYGCTEQLVSRLVPLLPLRDLAADYQVPLPKDLDRVVEKTVADVLSHQRGDGGFGLWAESPESMPWVTTYALWGLAVAKQHGAAVPEAAVTSATRYLRGVLPHLERGDVGLATMPFVLDVLAEQGAPDAGRATRLFERREELPLFSRALLLHAMVAGKSDPASIDKLATEIEGHLRLDGNVARAVGNTGDHYAVLMDSDTRTSALVLRALLAVRPAHPLAARLAMGLVADRRGGTWRNTQETAWSLLALDAYRRVQEATAPDFTAHVFLGDAEIGSTGFHGRSFAQGSASIPAARLVAAAGAPLGFTVEGQGQLFYEARLRYARRTSPREGIERGFFIKKTLRAVTPEGLAEALRTVPAAGVHAFAGGDLVLGDLVVVTPSPREFVVIDDPLPAGLEAVDARLATTGSSVDVDAAAARAGADQEPDADEVASGKATLSSNFIREIRDDRVLFFVDHLAAGMFHYRYLARATSLGSFVVPPTKVEEMYVPEVFGRTGGDVVRVTGK